MSKLAFGIDIGGTNTKIGLVENDGKVKSFISFPTHDPENFNEYVKTVFEHLHSMQHDMENTIIGIGIGAPNANSENGKIENPPNLKWGTVDIINEFKKYTSLPVFLENDANVGAVGEKIWGGAREIDDFVVVTLGTGIGTGIYVNGNILKGHNKLAAEGGHLTIVPDGRACNCGGFGHLECYASVRGIKETAKTILRRDVQFRELVDLYKKEDKQVKEIFNKTAEFLALGLSDMVVLLGPEKIFLAGGVATVGDHFTEKVNQHLDKFLFKSLQGSVVVETSKIATSEGAIIGAAALAMR